MKCFKINLNEILKILLLGKETLIPPKTHLTRRLNEYVLYVVTGGSLHLRVNDGEISLFPGDICLFDCQDFQAPLRIGFCEYYYIHFRADNISTLELDEDEYLRRLKSKHELSMRTDAFSIHCYDFLEVYIRQLSHIYDSDLFTSLTELLQSNIMNASHKEPEKRLLLSSAVSRMFLRLESSYIPKTSNTLTKPERTYDTVRKIAEYIEQSCTEPISGADIEKNFFLTFNHLNRIFGKVMGCTIFKYRNIVRIQYAKAKLRASNMSVGDIAAELGFENSHYFSRIFKQIEGLSPSDYKRKFMRIPEYGNDENPYYAEKSDIKNKIDKSKG